MSKSSSITSIDSARKKSLGYRVIPSFLDEVEDFNAANCMHQHVLTKIIMSVSFKPQPQKGRLQGITLMPGQLCKTRAEIAKMCGSGMSRDVVRRAIEHWQKAGILRLETVDLATQKVLGDDSETAHANKGKITLITICNYEEFTAKWFGVEEEVTQGRPRNEEQATHSFRSNTVTKTLRPKTSMSSSSNPTAKVSPLPSKISDQANEVFEHWKTVMGKGDRAKLNAKRKSAVLARFKEGYTVDDLKAAIDGCAKSPHHMGQNDRATMYNDLELICRDGAKVEKFAFDTGKGKAAAPKAAPKSFKDIEDERLQAEMLEGVRRQRAQEGDL